MKNCKRCGYGHRATVKRAERGYDAVGLPGITLHDVEVTHCPKCDDWDVAIPHVEELHRAIAHVVMAKRQRLTPAEIRFLRKQLGWSGVDLATQMGTTPETVSRWENGRTPIGATADRLLRLMVAVSERGADYSLGVLRVVARHEARATPIHVRWQHGEWDPVIA